MFGVVGAVTGLWSVTVNHGGGNGNLTFGTAVANVEGSATFTATSFPSGTLTDNTYIAASPVGHNFIGERVVFWGEGQATIDEPVVSTSIEDYSVSRLN